MLIEWRTAIADARLQLRADEAGGPGARATAVDAALDTYRTSLIRAGTELDLMPLGIPVAPIHLSDPAAGWRVTVATADERTTDRGLGPAIRRRGRALLLGPPGAGKSSALVQLAGGWAADKGELLPVVVRLQDVASSPPRHLKDLVQAGLHVPANSLVVGELTMRLRRGEAALFLDGLDECRDRRFAVMAALRQVIVEIDAGADVVLATRDVAYAEAKTLGWDDLRLLKPTALDEVLTDIGKALADREGLSGEAKDSWVKTRLAWLATAQADNPSIKETPLLLVLTLALLASHTPSTLPSTRARLLSDVVDDAARRLEIRVRGATQHWPQHSTHAVVSLLKLGFDVIGHGLFENGVVGRADLETALSSEIAAGWSFPPAQSDSAAAEIIDFWDEASVFVGEGHPPVVRGRIRSFIDLAEARYIARQELATVEAWVHRHADDKASTDALLLGAGLSGAIATAVVEEGVRRPLDAIALVACHAVERGVLAEPGRLRALVEAMATRVKDTYELASVKALARLPVPADLQEEVLQILKASSDTRATAMGVALAHATWRLPLDRTEIACKLVLSSPPPGGIFVDDGWVEAVTRCADLLLDADIDVETEVMAAYKHASSIAADQLDDVLRSHGRIDVVKKVQEDRYRTLDGAAVLRRMAASDDAWTEVFAHLAGRQQAPLTQTEARRLDALADLLATLEIGDAPSTWWDQATAHLDSLFRMFDLAVRLAGLPPEVIASEAALAATMPRLDAVLLLFDDATGRPLTRWDIVDSPELVRAELVELVSAGPLFALFSANALSVAPNPAETLRLVEPALSGLGTESRRIVARLLLALDQSDARLANWLTSDDPVRRVVAAHVVGLRQAESPDADLPLLEAALLSDDAAVRSEVANTVDSNGGVLPSDLVEKMNGHSPTGWRCIWCGTDNQPISESCTKCHVVGNKRLRLDSE